MQAVLRRGYKWRIIRLLGTGGVPYYGQCSNVSKILFCCLHNLLLIHEITGAVLKPPQPLTQHTTALMVVQGLREKEATVDRYTFRGETSRAFTCDLRTA